MKIRSSQAAGHSLEVPKGHVIKISTMFLTEDKEQNKKKEQKNERKERKGRSRHTTAKNKTKFY